MLQLCQGDTHGFELLFQRLIHRFHNLSFAEIAEALDITESAAKVRAHRGYERLRVLLQKLPEDE